MMVMMKMYLLMWVLGAAAILSEGDNAPTDDEDYDDNGSGHGNLSSISEYSGMTLQPMSDKDNNLFFFSDATNTGLRMDAAENANLSLGCALLILCMLI